MIDDRYIAKILDINQPMEESPIRFSMLILLLVEARKLSGRNLQTGVYERTEFTVPNFTEGTYHGFQAAGVISYLIFLEQLGSIFKSVNRPPSNKNSITRALMYFSDLDDQHIEARGISPKFNST